MAVHFDDLTFDESRRQLYRGEQPVHLSPKAFQLLGILIAEKPRAVSKEQLQERLWPETFVTEGNLASLIAELRSALGDDARKPRYIRTVHGFGYSFAADVNEKDEAAKAALPAAMPLRRPIPWAALIITVVLVLSVGAALIFNGSRADPRTTTTDPSIHSIAVLPFDTRGISKVDSHLGLGLADLVITRLSNVEDLTIRPTSAIRSYAGTDFDSRKVGRKLDVDAVLEGSIRTAGNRVRVTVQFLDVDKAKPIWADQFDEMKAEMLTIEDRISARVAEAVLVRLTPDEKTLLAKRYTSNPEAYQLYIQGRYHLLKGAGGPEDAPRIAANFFTSAIEKDPRYALAWADLAYAHVQTTWDRGGRASEYYPKAEQAALRARELDPQIYQARVPLALVRMYWHRDYAGAEGDLQSALALRPRDPHALSVYGYLLQSLGREDEALAMRQRLVDVDPLNPTSHWGMANGYLTAGRYDLARDKVEDVLAMDPDHFEGNIGLIRVLLHEQKYDEAIAYGRKLVASSGRGRGRAFLAYALARSGQKTEARKILQEMEAASRSQYVAPFNRVIVHIALGEYDPALSLLEEALEDGEYGIRLKTEPLLDPLRDDPRFHSLLRRAGFSS
jgi:DNA-binding winged helix-turn-helix (wHTH) protein/TolB-like protein/Tfp pilus assembly protein PilF